MTRKELESRIDKLWLEFHSGGITNPLTVIEQITYLMFFRLMDIDEARREKRAARTGKPVRGNFRPDEQALRWRNFKNIPAEVMLPRVRDEVFAHLRKVAGRAGAVGQFMKDAQLMIQKPSLLVTAVNMIDQLPLTEGDTKGDLYEYLLSKLTTAGINGQFRTPRHIIELMVDMVDPQPDDIIGDPACGTGGFLVAAMHHLLEENTSEQGKIVERINGETHVHYTGDLLEPYREHIQNHMFHGFDFDVTMLRIAAMNLMLHGVEAPNIHYQDTLANSFTENFPALAADHFSLILANPPFKGSLDAESVHPGLLGKVKTKKTELLFLVLMLRMLRLGGRCAVIVPDGVLFGSSKAHVALRKMLVEENELQGVVSLPSGVFKPYAGVSTAILLFTKGGRTDQVWFYDLTDDGFSLDDKRTQLYDSKFAGDLPDCLERWRARNPHNDTDRQAKAFFVPVDEIRQNKYDLSINRYKEVPYEPPEYDPPGVILDRLEELEKSILADIEELKGMVG